MEHVAAVVVTYNRLELLKESIDALRNQSILLERIIVINNSSTDGTEDWLKSQTDILTVTQPNNGGAGGFNRGIKEAYNCGYDWFWVMDDDTIPTSTALEELLKVANLVPNIGFLSSKVLWVNNDVHLMNIATPLPLICNIPYNQYSNDNIFLVPSASFVSLLLKSNSVKAVGLPIKEFFIWGDDIEYTARFIMNGYLGVYVNNSIVYHKTKKNYDISIQAASINDSWKYFYSTRNTIFIIKKESKSLLLTTLRVIKKIIIDLSLVIHRKDNRWKFFITIFKGCVAGIFFHPKVEYLD